ncbi:MAG: VCBS repeat-containing protein [Rhodothermales bacterium]|nr:VCBS repeat-containing protein [Rhodothermales bacterium]MBO6780063.1 VCBS repeat-containing protein [Rhodothermales bacterium]
MKRLAAALLILAGCSGGPVVLQPDAEEAPMWTRDVAPVTIQRADGETLLQPFLGGFNVPRPQYVDIDADGDLDLFIQEESGMLRFFERSEDRYVWRTDHYQNLDIGEWYRFVDLDQDGDQDLLAEQRFSHIRYFRNEGTAASPEFTLAVDTLRTADGRPLFADRQNIPNLVDIDCDGNIDLFVGLVTGMIKRFESIGYDSERVPRFDLVTERFEDIEIIGERQSRHGANTMTFGDVDGDGDQDLFWGDFFEAGVLLIRNRGSCGQASMRGEPAPFPLNDPIETSGYNAPSAADVDGDGDMDMAVGVLGGAFNANSTTVENLYYLEQTEPERFETRTSQLIPMIDVGSDSVPRVFDVDGDGDLDFTLANKIEPDDNSAGRVYVWRNEGGVYREDGIVALADTFHQTVAPGDLDGDGDLDLLVGKWNRDIAYFRNDDGEYTYVAAKYIQLTRGSNSSPRLVDIDADGDLDLFVGEASGTINFYRNEGTTTSPDFQLVSDEYLEIDIGRRSVPAFSDWDGDGDFDLFIGSELDGILVFENSGTPMVPEFTARGALDVPTPVLVSPEFADMDGDGDEDLVMGGVSGGVVYFERR